MATTSSPSRRLSHNRAFWAMAAITVTFPAAAPQPSTRVPVTSGERPAE